MTDAAERPNERYEELARRARGVAVRDVAVRRAPRSRFKEVRLGWCLARSSKPVARISTIAAGGFDSHALPSMRFQKLRIPRGISHNLVPQHCLRTVIASSRKMLLTGAALPFAL